MQCAHFSPRLGLALGLFVLTLGLTHGKASEDTFMKRLLDLVERGTMPASCTGRYPQTSTMCAYPDSAEVREQGVSRPLQNTIVDLHNMYRAAVSPPAANMAKMYWDVELAKVAQKWANTCPASHDTDENRLVPGYGVAVGQNMARDVTGWKVAVGQWRGEAASYKYGITSDYVTVGRYTQAVRDLATRVGCGYSKCSSGTYYVCNYALGKPHDLARPYKSGTTCSRCQNKCHNKLCDCDGMLCKNEGMLDQNTCMCKCTGAWTGKDCTTTTALPANTNPFKPPAANTVGACSGNMRDKVYCASYPNKYCALYPSWPEKCPITCGKCQSRCPGMMCYNSGSLQADCSCRCTAEWTGTDCQQKVSVRMCSPNTKDQMYCVSYPKHYCTLYHYFPTKCPIKCGTCIATCHMKRCENGGNLLTDCTCRCPPQWKGDQCQVMVRCAGKMCQNGGLLQSDCSCSCQPGWSGSLCQQRVTCAGMPQDYCGRRGRLSALCMCVCDAGFSGLRCSASSTPAGCGPDASYCSYFQRYCSHSYIRTNCRKMCGVC